MQHWNFQQSPEGCVHLANELPSVCPILILSPPHSRFHPCPCRFGTWRSALPPSSLASFAAAMLWWFVNFQGDGPRRSWWLLELFWATKVDDTHGRYIKIPSRKLTYHLKIDGWNHLFFRCIVDSFQGGYQVDVFFLEGGQVELTWDLPGSIYFWRRITSKEWALKENTRKGHHLCYQHYAQTPRFLSPIAFLLEDIPLPNAPTLGALYGRSSKFISVIQFRSPTSIRVFLKIWVPPNHPF